MKDILIIKPSSFGDILHGLQVAESIKQQLPDSRISWVVKDIFQPLVAAATAVSRNFVFRRGAGFGQFRRLLTDISNEPYDVVIDMQGLARSGVMTWAARAGLKLGRSDSREGAGLFYHRRAPLPITGKNAHALDILLQFLPMLGLKQELSSSITFKPQLSAQQDIDYAKDAIILFPQSSHTEKEWSGFVELARTLRRNFRHETIVIAGNTSNPAFTRLESDRYINLLGKTSLMDLIPLVGQSKLVVANDSGPMHLAAAMGKPVVALFGPTDPRRFGPYPLSAVNHYVLRGANGDLKNLAVADVVNQIKRIL